MRSAPNTGAAIGKARITPSGDITEDGPGLAPADAALRLSVNRPLLSSKRRRLPLHGILGNGQRIVAGDVAASVGWLAVATRGNRPTLAVDPTTGATRVAEDYLVSFAPGLTVSIVLGSCLPRGQDDDGPFARQAIEIARHGGAYRGPSSLRRSTPREFYLLMQQVMLADTTVACLCQEFGFKLDDERIVRNVDREDAIGPTLNCEHQYACHASSAWIHGGLAETGVGESAS